MKHLFKFHVVVFLLYGISIHAQTTIPASGGNASGTGGTVSYSVGQIAYTYESGSNGSIIQGLQQPYEISVVTGSKEVGITLAFSVYPNPVNDYMKLKISTNDLTDMSFWLYNINGNLIQNKKVVAEETLIDMQGTPSGAYFLKITSGSKELKTFKIIKK